MIINCSCDFIQDKCEAIIYDLHCACIEGRLTDCVRDYNSNFFYAFGLFLILICFFISCCITCIKREKDTTTEDKPPAYNVL